MAAANSVFSKSTDAFGFSPPLITDNLSTLDAQPVVAQTSKASTGSSNKVLGTSPPRPGLSEISSDSEWTMQPPTEPRSMRCKITPPPLRRGDSYRPSERHERYEPRLQHDLYRPTEHRYSQGMGDARRQDTSEHQEPGSHHHHDNSSDGEKEVSAAGDDHGHDGHTRHTPLRNSSDLRSGRKKEQAEAKVVSRRQTTLLEGDPGNTSLEGSKFDPYHAYFAIRGKMEILANKILQSPNSFREAGKGGNSRTGGIDHSEKEVKNRYGEAGTNDGLEHRDSDVLDRSRMLGLASSGGNSRLSNASLPLSRPLNVLWKSDIELPACGAHPVTLEHGDDGTEVERVDTAEKGSVMVRCTELSIPKATRELLAVPASRTSNEETASTSSTVTSKSKAVCKACGVPGSQVTPLVPCSRCEKGYHDRCGNPKPQSSANFNDFVCGRCLRRHSRDAVSRSELESNSNRSTPVDTHPPAMRSIPSSKPLKLARVPDSAIPRSARTSAGHDEANGDEAPENSKRRNTLPISQAVPARAYGRDAAMQGSLYKHITCPYWNNHGCRFMEAHCLYAHKDTGEYGPFGNAPAKAFTCPNWKRSGHCPKPAFDCRFSHKDTGQYIGPDNWPSRKHLTCHFWNFGQRCHRSEADCPFAHEATGLLAWAPFNASTTHKPVNSLRKYSCPRWEASGQCRWHDNRVCPYTHSESRQPCVDLGAPSQARARSLTWSRASEVAGNGSMPSAPTPKLSATPSWAENARARPVFFVDPVIPGGKNINTAEGLITAKVMATADVATVQLGPELASSSVEKAKVLQEDANAQSTPKSAATADTSSKLIRHMARSHALTCDPRKRRIQPPAPKPSSTLPGNKSTEVSSNHDSQNTAPTPNPSTCQHAAELLQRWQIGSGQRGSSSSVVSRTEIGHPSTFDAAHDCLEKVKAHCNKDPELFNKFLDLLQDLEGPAINTVETMQKVANLFMGRHLLVRELNTFLPPEYRIESGPGESADPPPPLASASSTSHDPRRRASTQAAAESSKKLEPHASTVAAGRKPCDGCGKSIFGHAPRCAKCSVSIGRQKRADQPSNEVGINMSIDPTLAPDPTGHTTVLELSESNPETQSLYAPTSPPSLQQYLMPNTLKRPLPEDALFVPRKKPKFASLSIGQATESLRRLSASNNAGFRVQADAAYTRWERSSLEHLTRVAMLEKGKGTEEGSSTTITSMAVEPLNGQTRQSHANRETSLGPDRSHPRGTPFLLAPAGSVSRVDDGKRAELPDTRPLKEASSVGTDIRKATSLRGTHHATGSGDEHSHGERANMSDTQVGANNQQVMSGPSTTELTSETLPRADRLESTTADSEPKKSNSYNHRFTHGHLDPDKYGKGMKDRKYASHTAAPSTNRAGAAHTADQVQPASPAISCIAALSTPHKSFVTSASARWTSARPYQTSRNTPVDDDDAGDDIPLILTRPLTRMTALRHSSITMSDIEYSDDIPLSSVQGRGRMRDGDSADISSLFKGTRKDSVLSSTTQPSTVGRADSRLFEGQDSSTATEVDQAAWVKEDGEAAIARLKAQGIMFESDSDNDEDNDDSHDLVSAPPRKWADPLWTSRQRSSNLFDILDDSEYYSGNGEVLPPEHQDRPSKKQLVGKLLKYQCREQKRKFGNPHQEVNRPLLDMEVKANIQRETRLETPNPFAVGRLEKTTVTMSVREFIGVPEEPVVKLGKNKDELVFIESKKVDRSGRTAATWRERRIKDDDKFPFVYK